MKKIHSLLLLVSAMHLCVSGQSPTKIKVEIDSIFASIRLSETALNISTYPLPNDYFEVQNALNPYFTDSVNIIRQSAYELIAEIGLHSNKPEVKNETICRLMESCCETESSIVNRSLNYLNQFQSNDFKAFSENTALKTLVEIKFQKNRFIKILSHYNSNGIIKALDSIANYSSNNHEKWTANLVLAKFGKEKSIQYCLNKLKRIEASNEYMYVIAPDILFTGQKELFDVLTNLFFDQDKKCTSSNPDRESKLHCGYYLMEILAPVIKDFPVFPNQEGNYEISLDEQNLENIRNWIVANPNYEIITQSN